MDKKLDRGGNTVTELVREAKAQLMGEKEEVKEKGKGQAGSGRSREEERLRAMRGSRSGKTGD